MSLRLDLADYDGRSVAVLEDIRRTRASTPARLSEAIDLIDAPDAEISVGATWLLRAWLEAGATLDEEQIAGVAERLDRVTAFWARLHLCQAVRSLGCPDPDAASQIAAFLRTCRQSDRPFLRAWATDGMQRLSSMHPRFRAEAARMLADAFADPAASVRARARRIADE